MESVFALVSKEPITNSDHCYADEYLTGYNRHFYCQKPIPQPHRRYY